MNADTKRYAWREHILKLVEKGDYESALRSMAQNCGDKGNIRSMIENFCENADPLEDNKRKDEVK